MSKLVRCARGAILDVVVDLRRGSPTFGEWESFELSGGQAAAGRVRLRPVTPERVLITGGGGQLASDLERVLAETATEGVHHQVEAHSRAVAIDGPVSQDDGAQSGWNQLQ